MMEFASWDDFPFPTEWNVIKFHGSSHHQPDLDRAFARTYADHQAASLHVPCCIFPMIRGVRLPSQLAHNGRKVQVPDIALHVNVGCVLAIWGISLFTYIYIYTVFIFTFEMGFW